MINRYITELDIGGLFPIINNDYFILIIYIIGARSSIRILKITIPQKCEENENFE
jgi:hypothetical protein